MAPWHLCFRESGCLAHIFHYDCLKNGKNLVWDYTCSDSLSESSISAGKAASNAENRKFAIYENLHEQYDVNPVCVETLGCWGHHGMNLVEEIGKIITTESGEKRSTSYLFKAIGILVQRGNCASILGTVANHKTLEKIYYL